MVPLAGDNIKKRNRCYTPITSKVSLLLHKVED